MAKDSMISVRLSAEQFEEIAAQARAEGITISEFMRRAIYMRVYGMLPCVKCGEPKPGAHYVVQGTTLTASNVMITATSSTGGSQPVYYGWLCKECALKEFGAGFLFGKVA